MWIIVNKGHISIYWLFILCEILCPEFIIFYEIRRLFPPFSLNSISSYSQVRESLGGAGFLHSWSVSTASASLHCPRTLGTDVWDQEVHLLPILQYTLRFNSETATWKKIILFYIFTELFKQKNDILHPNL